MVPDEEQIVAEQLAYYRARAPEYDEWFLRQGRYDRGDEHRAQWFAEVDLLEAALDQAEPGGDVLELACGTGIWTGRLAAAARRLTAVDASPEALALNRARGGAPHVTFVEADLFRWQPPATYDFIFFGFWLSHVPRPGSRSSGNWCAGPCARRGRSSCWTACRRPRGPRWTRAWAPAGWSSATSTTAAPFGW
jgi:SAM-dependent methyltransferase